MNRGPGNVRPRLTARRPLRYRYSKSDFLKAFDLGIEIGEMRAAADPEKGDEDDA